MRFEKKCLVTILLLVLGGVLSLFYVGFHMGSSVSSISAENSASFMNNNKGQFAVGSLDNTSFRNYTLVASKQNVSLRAGGPTEMYTYNGQFPGPTLRAREGDTVRVLFKNRLDEPSTIHWHGMQVENAMDGVPGVTQDPVLPGEEFVYEFTVNQSGTYWYHPHYQTDEQIERGLYGALVIEDAQTEDLPEVDRDEVLLLDDIRLNRENQIPYGSSGHDVMHGRMGNSLLVNGLSSYDIELRAEEVLRLRLINPSNARTYSYTFGDKAFYVIGHDIGRLESAYKADSVRLSPGQRKDILVSFDSPGTYAYFVDLGYDTIKMGEIAVNGSSQENSSLSSSLSSLNRDIPEWDFLREQEPNVTITMSPSMRRGNFQWTLNGKSSNHEPEQLSFEEGKRYQMRFINTHGQPHPMHLHGQKFLVLSRNGEPVTSRGYMDTVYIRGGETVDIAFIAEGEGTWVNHCHILEHAEAGMLLEMDVIPSAGPRAIQDE